MKSRWLLAAAVLGGVIAAPVLAWVSAVLAVPFVYDTLRPFFTIAFVIFTVMTVPVSVLVAWAGTPRQRGFAVGLLIGWAAIGIWVGLGAPGAEVS